MIDTINTGTLSSRARQVWGRTAAAAESVWKTLRTDSARRARPQNPSLPAGVRKEKVLAIRRQLDEGTYDIDGRLDELMDRILEEDLLK